MRNHERTIVVALVLMASAVIPATSMVIPVPPTAPAAEA